VDEIVVLNVTRDQLPENDFPRLIQTISKRCFVPLTAGGWVTSEESATKLLRNGADKICVNTQIVKNPTLIKKLAEKYGSQCITGSVDVKTNFDGKKTIYVDRGREDTHEGIKWWVARAAECGVGEILFNNIDHDGNRNGYDLPTLTEIVKISNVPVVAFGGVLTWEHLAEGLKAGADAVAAANIFHYTEHSAKKAKRYLREAGFEMRSD
jgi:cyclase